MMSQSLSYIVCDYYLDFLDFLRDFFHYTSRSLRRQCGGSLENEDTHAG